MAARRAAEGLSFVSFSARRYDNERQRHRRLTVLRPSAAGVAIRPMATILAAWITAFNSTQSRHKHVPDSLAATYSLKLKKRFEVWRKTQPNDPKLRITFESRSGFAQSLFRLDGLPRLRDQSQHSPAALLLKSFSPPLGDASSSA